MANFAAVRAPHIYGPPHPATHLSHFYPPHPVDTAALLHQHHSLSALLNSRHSISHLIPAGLSPTGQSCHPNPNGPSPAPTSLTRSPSPSSGVS